MSKHFSITRAIKNYCRDCCRGHNPRTYCISVSCSLFPYKCGKKTTDISEQLANTKDVVLYENLCRNWEKWVKNHQFGNKSRLKAIKDHCMDCAYEGRVKQCKFDDCPLYLFRFGRNMTLPKRVVGAEYKAKLVANLKKNILRSKKYEKEN